MQPDTPEPTEEDHQSSRPVRRRPARAATTTEVVTADTANDGQVLPPPTAPLDVARIYLDKCHTHPDGCLVLRAWRGGNWVWNRSKWVEVEPSALRAEIYGFTETATFVDDKGGVKPWSPTRHKIANLTDAIAAAAHLDDNISHPGWIETAAFPPARELVSMSNGLLHVPTRDLLPHNPRLWNQSAVPFPYDQNAPAPARWLEFLDQLWPEDPDAIKALQEYFGYVISGRTDLHKILLLVGPTRGGKGVIARILKELVGDDSHAGPTLSSLATNFGLSPLIGRSLAIVADARLGSGNQHQVVERLLSISGEDVLTIDRKYREPWTGTLPTRFVVISNELPAFGDHSGAIARRFLVLTLQYSWLGKEDTKLTDQLYTELPGILRWALDGLGRLEQKGSFTEPSSSVDAIISLQDAASPTSAFVRDLCTIGIGEVTVDDLWGRWKYWAKLNGHRSGNKQQLGRNIRAAVPGVKLVQPREGSARRRTYQGLSLKTDPQ